MRVLLPGILLFFVLRGLGAATIQEDFASDPAGRGWARHGESNLFTWDSTNRSLAVTWDSSRTNSYFHKPLGTILARDDDFSLEFDLWLDDIQIGTTPGKPYTFQIAVSLFNFAAATRSNLFVGTGANASTGLRSAVEFNYFPDSGFGATFSCIAVSSNSGNYAQFRYGHDFPTEFDTGVWHHLALSYAASNQTLSLVKTRDGAAYGMTNRVRLDTLISGQAFTDFRLDTVAIASYSDAGQGTGSFAGSVLAHGVVDNLVVTVPDPPAARPEVTWSNGVTRVAFSSRTNWQFALERTTNFSTWVTVPGTAGGVGPVEMTDPGTPDARAYYRVKGGRP